MKHFKLKVKFIVSIVFIFLNILVFGQIQRLYYFNDFTIVDSASIEITYTLEWINDTASPNDKQFDIQKLLIGKRVSKTYSYLLFQNDSIRTILENQNLNFPSPPSGASSAEIIRNNKTGNLKISHRSDETVFCYEEMKTDLGWVILNEKKTIENYNCQRAVLTFRGRKYEAWFTIEIPISLGPFKFHGLPGLILEINDEKMHYRYKCIGVEKLPDNKLISIRNWDCNNTTREELNEFFNQKHKNPSNYYNSQGVTFFIKQNGKIVSNPKNYSLPYNPIELE